jgi:peptidoglycan/LPS O-acetylase OafA/YrhL
VPLGVVALNVFVVGQDLFQAVVNSVNYGQINPLVALLISHAPKGFFENDWMLIGQAWSLASEILFYALAPFIVRSIPRILVAFCVSVAIRWALVFGAGFHSEVWSYDFFPSTLCLFLLGGLAYHLYKRIKEHPASPAFGAAILGAFAVFCVVSIWQFGGVLLIDRVTGFDTIRLWTAYVLFAFALPFLFARWKSNKVDRWIGELSYPLYIVHGLIIGVVFWKVHFLHHGGKEILAAAISICVAAGFVIFIDSPVDAWRHRRFLAKKPAPQAEPEVGAEAAIP